MALRLPPGRVFNKLGVVNTRRRVSQFSKGDCCQLSANTRHESNRPYLSPKRVLSLALSQHEGGCINHN